MNTSKLIVLAGVSAALSVALSGCDKSKAAVDQQVSLRTVTIAPVEQGPDVPPIQIVGVIQNRDEARLAFKVGGVIRDINVREGDTVKAGQVLATLQTDEVDASVTQNEENYAKAKRDLERGQKLFAQEVITKSQLDDLGTAAAVAQAGARAARFNRGTAQIIAPASGMVLQRLAQAKEVVAAGQPVITVGSASAGLVIKAGLTDRQVTKVKRGDKASIVLDALPGQTLTAQVLEVGQAPDARAGTYRLEARVDAASDRVLPGMVGRLTLMPASSRTLTYIPLQALIEGDQNKAWVFTATPVADKAQRYTVKRVGITPAFITERQVALTDALPANTQLVTSGAAFLNDGEVVIQQVAGK